MHKVEVYRNLHKHCWSIRDTKTGRVVSHADSVYLKGTNLVVRPGGRAKVLRDKRKNVHAFIKGYIDNNIKPLSATELTQITYNPYKYESFVITNSEAPIYNSNNIYLDSDGKAFTYEKYD